MLSFLQTTLSEISLSLTWQILLSLVAAFLFYLILNGTGRKILKKLTEPEYLMVKTIIRIPLLVFLFNTALLIPLAHQEGRVIASVRHFFVVTLIFSIAWLGIRIVDFFRLLVFKKYNINVADNLKARKIHTQLAILERVINIIIIFSAITIALMTFESIKRIGISLFASAGVAGIIIGLSAQKVIATFIAGVQLAITQPIRVDDVLIVEGEWGRVEEIKLTYIVVRIWDKRRLVLPSTYFIEKPFQNWTYKSADILGTVYLYTDYTVPFEEIRKELDHILEGNELWDGDVKVMQVTDATEKTVEIRLLVSARDASTAWSLRVYLREKMIEFIKDNYPESLPRTRVEFKGEKGLQEINSKTVL